METNMETVATTPAINKMQTKLNQLDENSFRYDVLHSALKFKTNWIELGEKLYKVYHEKSYKEWGYDTFDKYCSKEVGIRKKTIEKLTNSYYFLQKHEPEVLEDYSKKNVAEIPDYNTINLLSQIKSDENVTEEIFDEFKEAAFNEGCTDRALKKRYNNLLDELKTDDEENEENEQQLQLKHIMFLVNSFEKIDRKIEDMQDLPVDIKTDVKKLLTRLKELTE